MWFASAGFGRLCRPNPSRLEKLCGIILIFWCALELKDLVFYTNPVIRENFLSNLLILVDMTAIPAGFCFASELINRGWCTPKRAILSFAPYLLTIIIYAITESMWAYHGVFIYSCLYGICYLVYLFFQIKRYNRLISENYSNIDHLQVSWLWEVVILLVVAFAIWTISCYFTSWIVDSCYQILLFAMWAIIVYHADRQQTPQEDMVDSENLHASEDGHNTLTAPLNLPSDGILSNALVQKLESLLSEQMIWKNPHLTLSDLAIEVGTNRTYLSNYLNNTLHTTFYDYINAFRLEAAVRKLEDPNSTATMVEIAEACGFNSISTFRRVFIRTKGCSLAEYRNSKISTPTEK